MNRPKFPLVAPRSGTNAMVAIILAGGRGSRLRELTSAQAKPALHFGGLARLIDFPLSNCVNSGIRRIGVATQFCSTDLSRHIQSSWSFLSRGHGEFVDLWPARQREESQDWYRGTADAVLQNLDLILAEAPEHVLILAGDHVYKQDYGAMLADHVRRGADVSVACLEVPRAEARQFGCVEVDGDDRIVNFIEKPSDPPCIPGDPAKSFASMGIYIFKTDFLVQALRTDARDARSSHDFGGDVLPAWIRRRRVVAHRFALSCVGEEPSASYWKDVGTVDAFWQAHMDLLGEHPPIDLFAADWPIWTDHPVRAPARIMRDGAGRNGIADNCLVGPGSAVIGAEVSNSVLGADVRVGPACRLDRCVLLPGAVIEAGCVLSRAIVGEGVVVPAGFDCDSGAAEPCALDLWQSPAGVQLITTARVTSRPLESRPAPVTLGNLLLAAGD